MLTSITSLLHDAQRNSYAVGAFNVYNLEGVKAVIAAAESTQSPVILQIHPKALEHGGAPLVALSLQAAGDASVPASVHLDHSSAADMIHAALTMGIPSVMADGSGLAYNENVLFSRAMAEAAHKRGASVEAELGRISGSEDGFATTAFKERMTDPQLAADFVERTGVDALAVCIGNVHGLYSGEPVLDFDRLKALRQSVSIPLVLHGTSGLPAEMIRQAIECGVSKFNINTEVRKAYIEAARTYLMTTSSSELLDLMDSVVAAMQATIGEKFEVFGSAGKAGN